MPLEMDDDELVGAAEVAARLGLRRSRQVLDLRLHRFGFPRPVARTGRNLVWSWPQVAHWAEREGFDGGTTGRAIGHDASVHSPGGHHGGTR
jgi:predicted DNA-binding transcriptional regulator AlpA